jgi:hypothetical protein
MTQSSASKLNEICYRLKNENGDDEPHLAKTVGGGEKEMMIDHLQKLRPPGIALILAGCLNGMIGLLALLGGLFRLSGIRGSETLPVNEAERLGYLTSTVITYGASLLSVLVAPVIIYAAVQMMRGKNYKMARTAAILTIIPFTSCCFLIGIPIGIWTLVVLSKPDVKAVFNSGARFGNISPPGPPQSW